jgi:hypothetical protein
MTYTFHLEFNPYDADHRWVAEWLAAQPDPTEAVVRLIKAAREGERRMQRWQELSSLLANEMQAVRAQMRGQPPKAKSELNVREDPESAQRLDSMFK